MGKFTGSDDKDSDDAQFQDRQKSDNELIIERLEAIIFILETMEGLTPGSAIEAIR